MDKLKLTASEAEVLLDVLIQHKPGMLYDLLTVAVIATPSGNRRDTLANIKSKLITGLDDPEFGIKIVANAQSIDAKKIEVLTFALETLATADMGEPSLYAATYEAQVKEIARDALVEAADIH